METVLQLLDPGLPAAVLGALDRAGLSPLNLHLEIVGGGEVKSALQAQLVNILFFME